VLASARRPRLKFKPKLMLDVVVAGGYGRHPLRDWGEAVIFAPR
jgi:hypothetical protein